MPIQMLYILTPAGAVDTAFPHDTEAPLPALPADWAATWTAPASSAPPIRRITAAAFVERFTPAEVRALQGDDILNRACLKATAQGHVNLDSPELAALMAYAKAAPRNFLTDQRIAEILRNGAPEEAVPATS